MSQPGGRNNDKGKGIAGDPITITDEESLDSNLGVKEDSATDAEEDAASESPATIDFLSGFEDSLPMKRGLSSHYTGKSKSFSNLTDIGMEEELSKKEHPVNKKRRLLNAHDIRIKEMEAASAAAAGDSSANVPDQPSDDDDDDDQKKKGDEKEDGK